MYRRFSSVLVSLALILATAAVSASAQSGRGRQLRIQQTLGGEAVARQVADVQPASNNPDAPAVKTGAARRNSILIYDDATSNKKKDDGEYHMTKGDKRAGWIILGVLVLGAIAQIIPD